MKRPDVDVVETLRAEIARDEDRLQLKRRALTELERIYGVTEAAPNARPVKGRKGGRPTIRRARANKAKALRGAKGRRRPLAPGSLADRIVETLTARQAPMRKAPLVEAVKAPAAAVTAELKRLRADGRLVMVGARAGARWALPKFSKVIVAEDTA